MENEKVILTIPNTNNLPGRVTLLKSLVQAPNNYVLIVQPITTEEIHIGIYRKDLLKLYEDLWGDRKRVLDDTALMHILVDNEDEINFLLHKTCDLFVILDQGKYILKARNTKKKVFETFCCAICYKYFVESVIPNDKFGCTHNKEYCDICYDNIEQCALCRST
jgi:hypothetical protein